MYTFVIMVSPVAAVLPVYLVARLLNRYTKDRA